MVRGKKEVRKLFRNSVFNRDKNCCKYCGAGPFETPEDHLDAHHITDRNDMPNGGYVLENGISLCKDKCHINAEMYHISDGDEWIPGMHPDDLYKLIKSSKELAIRKSEEL